MTVTLATFMEVLDTSIANVSLPHIAGSLSASPEESTWVLTSYLVSNAIILPISAWLSPIIGRKPASQVRNQRDIRDRKQRQHNCVYVHVSIASRTRSGQQGCRRSEGRRVWQE